jgi:hypothetical protein
MRLIGPDQVRKLLTEVADHLDIRVHPDNAVSLGEQDKASEGDREPSLGRNV